MADPTNDHVKFGQEVRDNASQVTALQPRLVDVRSAAGYLGIRRQLFNTQVRPHISGRSGWPTRPG